MIQIPPGFDISTLKELPLPRGSFDRRTFSVEDGSFGIEDDVEKENASKNKDTKSRVKLLAAGGDEGNLQVSSKSFSRYLQITPEISIPSINYDEVVIPKPKVAPIEGLRLQHHSTGYGPSKSELEAERVARLLNEPSDKKSKKKKHSMDDDDEEGPAEKKRKKEKKEKKDKKEKKEKKDKKKSK